MPAFTRQLRVDSRLSTTRAFAALTLLCSGCGMTQRPARCERSESIALNIRAATHLNPDRAGFPRSVVLRLYQLGDARAFETRSFESVWAQPGAAPQAHAEQLIAIPGREQAYALRRDPKATHLAVAANFREHRGASSWRARVRLPEPRDPCAPLPQERRAPIELTLANYDLQLR